MDRRRGSELNREEKRERKHELLEKAAKIRAVLNEWAPIGGGTPEDEYDCLIPKLIVLLEGGAGEGEVKDLLSNELMDHFGIHPPMDSAKIACRLRESIDRS